MCLSKCVPWTTYFRANCVLPVREERGEVGKGGQKVRKVAGEPWASTTMDISRI